MEFRQKIESEAKLQTQPFDFRKEEYLSLRKEIETNLAELSALERNCVIAASTAYAWVATNASLQQEIVQTAWLVPALIPVYGAVRSKTIGEHLDLIGEYLRTVEARALPKTAPIDVQEGWEHFFKAKTTSNTTNRRKDFWVSLVLVSALCSGLGFWLTPSAEKKAKAIAAAKASASTPTTGTQPSQAAKP
jgi:hypothetical protein